MHNQYYSIQLHPASSVYQNSEHPCNLQERILKIKNKYGTRKQKYNNRQYIQSKLNYSVCDEINASKISVCDSVLTMSMIAGNSESLLDNKENSTIAANTSLPTHKDSIKMRKSNKGHKRIQELEEINQKIGKLIECLKLEESNTEADHKVQNSTYSTRVLTQEANDTLKTAKTQQKNELGQLKLRLKTEENKDNNLLNATKNYNPRKNIPTREYRSVQSRQSSSRCGQIYNSQSKEFGKLSRTKSISQSEALIKNADQLHYQAYSKQRNQKKFISQIAKQIQFDKLFMKNKTKLIRKGKQAKKQLQAAINMGNWTVQEKQLVLEWSFEDIDPLYTQRESTNNEIQNTNQLVFLTIQSFIKCQTNWKSNILRKFNSESLCFQDLDIEGKGYFLKEDLTRFLSLQTRNMYCNRDINLVFKRLNNKKNKIVGMKELISSVCYR